MRIITSWLNVRRTLAVAIGLTILVGSPVEAEPGLAPGTIFTVTNTNNSGTGSLRQAITDANNNAGADTINFNIPLSDPGCNAITQVCTISLSSTLGISTPVTIDGYTQPGAQANTNSTGGLNTVLKAEISGPATGTALVVIFTSDVTVRGLVINHCSTALSVDIGVSNLRIEGNFIGTNPAGTQAAATTTGISVATQGGGAEVFIGGPTAAARNLISGNSNIGISTSGNFNGANAVTVQDNLIGTDISGQAALGNGFSGIQVGTFTPTSFVAKNNVISGNGADGIAIAGQGTSFSGTVQGNRIGVAADGATPLGNGGRGILYEDRLPYNMMIGGTNSGEGNIIGFNNDRGVIIDSGGAPGGPTGIVGNSIFSNGRLGIDLIGGTQNIDGVTMNDSCDSDTGPNNLQNFPVITSATLGGGMVTLSGTLNSLPNTTFRLEFFSSGACDPSGFGEGQTFLGSTMVTTDGSCNASFGPLAFAISTAHLFVTATATDPGNNTSEFSPCTSATAVSRKAHGAAGTFDIILPLVGTTGIECRAGGTTNDYTIVFAFPGNVVVTGNPQAQVTLGTATIGSGGVSNGGMVTVSGAIVTIPLTNVANAQTINVRLNGVNGASAEAVSTADVIIPMSILAGDSNGDRVVNSGDAIQTRNRSGQMTDGTNFRSDVNRDGFVNSGDTTIVRSRSGTSVP